MTNEGYTYIRPELLEHYKVIGLVENFQKGLDDLSNAFQTPKVDIKSIPRLNISTKRLKWENLTPDDQEEVKYLLRDEINLYNYIKS